MSPPPDEPQRCTTCEGTGKVYSLAWDGALKCPDCPTHGPNRPEPTKEAGQELPTTVAKMSPARLDDIERSLRRWNANDSLYFELIASIRQAWEERDAANQRAQAADFRLREELELADVTMRLVDNLRGEVEKLRPVVEEVRRLRKAWDEPGRPTLNPLFDALLALDASPDVGPESR